MFNWSRGKTSVQYETNRLSSFALTCSPLKAIKDFVISTDVFSTMWAASGSSCSYIEINVNECPSC